MVDTVRTAADLLANLFQDGQAAGSITPQDLRDYIVSVQDSYGGIDVVTPAATVIAVAGTFVKMAGTTSFVAPNKDFTMPTNNRLTYGGTVPKSFLITANASFVTASNNQIIAFTSAINGTPGTARSRRKVGTGADVGSISGHRIVTLNPGDFLEVFITNETTATEITIEDLAYFVTSLFT
jgi:hypothetical protein